MVPYHKKSHYNQSPEFRIAIEGFMTGLFAGIAIKTGIDADPSSLLVKLFDAIIKVGESINPEENYRFYKGLFAVGMSIFAIIGFIETIYLDSDRTIGILILAFGFILGLVLCIIIL